MALKIFNYMTENKCYLCRCNLEKENISDEHIIPQVLGGCLISNKLLCRDCNSKLGKTIDAKFVKTFEPLICTLDIIGRDSNKGVNCKILTEDREIDGIIQNGKLYPKKPFFTMKGNKVNFYGSKKNLKYFKKIIQNEAAKRKINTSELVIKCIDDVTGFFTVDFHIDNQNFYESMTKIALNFALENSIPYEVLEHLISKKDKKIESGILLPYLPLTDFEKILERSRNKIEPDFPSHTILLFSERLDKGDKMLVCYIDLFSTFQFYIILSTEYKGSDVFIPYFQRIKREIIVPYSADENALCHKSILPDIYEVESRHPSIKVDLDNPKKLKKLLDTYLSQARPYKADYKDHLKLMYDNLAIPLVYFLKPDPNIKKMLRNEILEKIKEFSDEEIFNANIQMHQFYYICYDEKADIVLEKHLRRIIVNKGKLQSIFSVLTPEYVKSQNDLVKKYGHEKFNALMEYVNLLFLEKKAEKLKQKE